MSSDEEVMHSEEEEDSRPSGPSEAELAMQKKKAMAKLSSMPGLTEDDQDMLAANQVMRDQMGTEINEMRTRSERRKKEREEEEKRMAAERAAEDQRRKADEEERKRKKEDEENKRRDERAEKMAEFEKAKNPEKPNFVISKRQTSTVEKSGGEEETGGDKKSKEQLEAEKKAILAQRIQPLNIDGADHGKLTEKAKELQALIMRLESEKYDLEKRFKGQQVDMMELADKARQMNKTGRGGLKRSKEGDDKMAERFAGCPSKIVMYSEYERQKDPRGYGDRQVIFKGPVYGHAAERIKPARQVVWKEDGLPQYQGLPGAEPRKEEGGEEEEEEE